MSEFEELVRRTSHEQANQQARMQTAAEQRPREAKEHRERILRAAPVVARVLAEKGVEFDHKLTNSRTVDVGGRFRHRTGTVMTTLAEGWSISSKLGPADDAGYRGETRDARGVLLTSRGGIVGFQTMLSNKNEIPKELRIAGSSRIEALDAQTDASRLVMGHSYEDIEKTLAYLAVRHHIDPSQFA